MYDKKQMRSYLIQRRSLPYTIKQNVSELALTCNVLFYSHTYLNDKKWEA